MNISIADITNHVRAIDSSIPGHAISAYALELLEELRLAGKEKRIGLRATGRSVTIPGKVQAVHKVWCNGVLIPQTLPDSETFSDDLDPAFTYILDADGAYIADYDGSLLVE